jgi:hypothetical protein
MSTSARLAILMVIAACDGPDGATSPNLTDSRFTVSGMVYDSLAREVGGDWNAPGVRLSVNGVVVISDAAGHFTATGVSGASEARVVLESQNYERQVESVTIEGDLTIDIGLRRLAPLVTDFRPFGDSTQLTVVDLQNRKTVERWRLTQAFMQNATADWTQFGIEWVWTPVDDETWLASISNTGAAQQFRFDIHDVDGSAATALCSLAGGCNHLETGVLPQ